MKKFSKIYISIISVIFILSITVFSAFANSVGPGDNSLLVSNTFNSFLNLKKIYIGGDNASFSWTPNNQYANDGNITVTNSHVDGRDANNVSEFPIDNLYQKTQVTSWGKNELSGNNEYYGNTVYSLRAISTRYLNTTRATERYFPNLEDADESFYMILASNTTIVPRQLSTLNTTSSKPFRINLWQRYQGINSKPEQIDIHCTGNIKILKLDQNVQEYTDYMTIINNANYDSIPFDYDMNDYIIKSTPEQISYEIPMDRIIALADNNGNTNHDVILIENFAINIAQSIDIEAGENPDTYELYFQISEPCHHNIVYEDYFDEMIFRTYSVEKATATNFINSIFKAIDNFLDVPLFFDITIGMLLWVAIIVYLAIWALKMFAGG